MKAQLPVTILTGFLGSGKTTLLKRILEEEHGLRIGVILNEFGEISIDGELVNMPEGGLMQLNNGCLCCTVREDFERAARQLLQHAQA
ncbi:CobW family GTP-binding protein, partial [Synechococcus sp. R55.2]